MGLDIAFNRQKALDAGMRTQRVPNCDDPDQIREAHAEVDAGYGDAGYAAWLEEEADGIQVPGMGHWVEDNGADEDVIVRANKWGRTYDPLTRWLRANDIEWSEF